MDGGKGIRTKESSPLTLIIGRKEYTMEVFRWVKAMLLGTTIIIAVRLVAKEAGWESVALWTGYAGVVLVLIGAILAIIGVWVDRRHSAARGPIPIKVAKPTVRD